MRIRVRFCMTPGRSKDQSRLSREGFSVSTKTNWWVMLILLAMLAAIFLFCHYYFPVTPDSGKNVPTKLIYQTDKGTKTQR